MYVCIITMKLADATATAYLPEPCPSMSSSVSSLLCCPAALLLLFLFACDIPGSVHFIRGRRRLIHLIHQPDYQNYQINSQPNVFPAGSLTVFLWHMLRS